MVETSAVLPAASAFRLLHARGIPLDFLRDECARRGVRLDESGVDALIAEEQQRARAARASGTVFYCRVSHWSAFEGLLAAPGSNEYSTALTATLKQWASEGRRTEELALVASGAAYRSEARCVAVTSLPSATPVRQEGALLLDRCPFYARGGGQIGDTGVLRLADGETLEVTDTVRVSPTAVAVLVSGTRLPSVDEEVVAEVGEVYSANSDRRCILMLCYV